MESPTPKRLSITRKRVLLPFQKGREPVFDVGAGFPRVPGNFPQARVRKGGLGAEFRLGVSFALVRSMVTAILGFGPRTWFARSISILAVIGVASNIGVCLCGEGGDHGRSGADSRPHATAPHSHSHSQRNPHPHGHDDPTKKAPAGHSHGPNGECTCGGPEVMIRTEADPTISSPITQQIPAVLALTVPGNDSALQPASGLTPPAVGPPQSDRVPLLIRICRLLI